MFATVLLVYQRLNHQTCSNSYIKKRRERFSVKLRFGLSDSLDYLTVEPTDLNSFQITYIVCVLVLN